MGADSTAIIVAAIGGILTGITGLVVAVFSGMATRRKQIQDAAQLKLDNEAIARAVEEKLTESQREIAEKLAESQRESTNKLKEIHDTFNSKMDAAMKDLRDKYYAMGQKDEKDRVALAAAEAINTGKEK
jgi:gas vesicle protein